MSTKQCTICKLDKDLAEFNKSAGRRDGLQSHCRICSKEKFNKYYNANKGEHIKNIVERNKEHRKKILQFVYDYLKSHPCVDCGEKDPRVLEFDHVRDVKDMAISSMLRNNHSIERIQSEIVKCDVRCANCHRRKTAIEQNWYGKIDLGS